MDFDDYFASIRTSYQVQQIFVDAAGAYFNESSNSYMVNCGSMAKVANVLISMDDGMVITLTPKDFIIQKVR